MSTLATQKLGEAKTIIANAKAILEDAEASQEEKNKIPEMLETAKNLKTEAGQLQMIESLSEVMPEADDLVKAGGHAKDAKSGFASFDEYLKALLIHQQKGERDERLKYFTEAGGHDAGRDGQKDLSSGVGADGGFLVAGEHYNEIMAAAAPDSIVRSRATIIPMKGRTVDFPILDQTVAGTGGTFFGGLSVYWDAEAATIAQGEPKFALTTMTAHELTVYTPVPNSLIEDSVTSLEGWLTGPMGIPGAIAWKEDDAFLNGNGAGQPQGILNAPATIAQSRATSSEINYVDLINMQLSHWGDNPVWLVSRTGMGSLMQMEGPSGNPSYLWGNATSGRNKELLGIPIVMTDKLADLGTAGDIMLCDFTYYLIGDRQRTTMAFSQDYLFRSNRLALRAVHRVDGQPWLKGPITFKDTTTQVSPFVYLAA